MFMSGPKFFGKFLKVVIERERSLLFDMLHNMRLLVKVNVFLNNLILYDLDCIKCTKE